MKANPDYDKMVRADLLATIARQDRIISSLLRECVRPPEPTGSLWDVQVTRIMAAMVRHAGRRDKIAKELGITTHVLRRKLKRMAMDNAFPLIPVAAT